MDEIANKDCGYLELILGCMFSGKTTRLLDIHKKYSICDISCCVINFKEDVRYSQTEMMSHDKKGVPCLFSEKLENAIIKENLEKYDVFLINEGQFFEDLISQVKKLVLEHKKKVYICGLDGDFEREKFGNLLDLIPFADKFYKLYAICKLCKNGTRAPFSKRISNETKQTVIGSDNYIPVCRKCYESC